MAQITLNSSGVASSGSLLLQTNGTTTQATVDTSGNLGLGVTPSAWGSGWKTLQIGAGANFIGRTGVVNQLQLIANGYFNGTNYIYQNTGEATQYFQTGGYHAWGVAASGTAGNAITFTQAMTLDASGNLGIGTTSPATKLAVTGGIAGTAGLNISGAGWGVLPYVANSTVIDNNSGQTRFFATGADATTDGSFLFYTSQTDGGANERMRITSTGQIFVNTTSSLNGTLENFQLYPVTSGSSQYGMMVGGNAQSYTVYAMRFLNTYTPAVVGSITIGTTSTAYNTSSDYRLKNSIAPMTGALAKVAALKPVTYKWNADDSDGEGFIAHELAEVVPQAVVGEKDAVDEDGNPVYQGIDTSFLVATLTAAIQEQQAIITKLQADVAALKGQA